MVSRRGQPPMIKPCHCCKRVVAYRFRHIQGGKGRVRHKCSHGNWCATGHSLNGLYAIRPLCRECLNERRAEAGLPPLRKLVRSSHWHLSFLFLLLSCGPAVKSLDCVAQHPYERSTHENCQMLNSCVPGQLCTCKSRVVTGGCQISCEGVAP